MLKKEARAGAVPYHLARPVTCTGRDPMTRLLTADAVAALLAHFPDDQFESTSTELQAGFRVVAGEFSQLFGQISFGKVGAYVSSSPIEAALDSLAAAGFYSRYNKDLVTYDLNRAELKSYYDTFLRERLDKAGIDTDIIKEAARRLRDALADIRQGTDLERLLVVS